MYYKGLLTCHAFEITAKFFCTLEVLTTELKVTFYIKRKPGHIKWPCTILYLTPEFGTFKVYINIILYYMEYHLSPKGDVCVFPILPSNTSTTSTVYLEKRVKDLERSGSKKATVNTWKMISLSTYITTVMP